MAYEHKSKTYEVTVCGQVYYYALHSGRKNKIIFLSQVLNILEYVLFRKMKDGFRAPGGIITQESFPFKVVRLKNRNPDDEPWERYDATMAALQTLLQEYYDSAISMLNGNDEQSDDASPVGPSAEDIGRMVQEDADDAVEAIGNQLQARASATENNSALEGEIWNP